MRRIGTLAIVLAICAPLSACGSSSSQPPFARSPKAALASIVAAALAQQSVHWKGSTSADLYGTDHSTADVNADSGATRLTYYGHAMDTRLVDGTVYVRGAPTLLMPNLSLTQAEATHYAGRWISSPRGDKLYGDLSSGLTLASIVHGAAWLFDQPRSGLKVLRRTSRGTRLLVLRAPAWPHVFSNLTARASGKPLPIAYTLANGLMDFRYGHFSKWNEPVSVQAPARSTPIATVRRG